MQGGAKTYGCHPEAGEARRGTSQSQVAFPSPLPRSSQTRLPKMFLLVCAIQERLWGPSPSARLGMTA